MMMGLGVAELVLILMVLLLLVVPFLIVGLVLYFLFKLITKKEVPETTKEHEFETVSENQDSDDIKS